jgi:hypothetical protein
VFLRARYLDTASGRFMTRDQWDGRNVLPISNNEWIFGYSNPIKYSDHSGDSPCEEDPNCREDPFGPFVPLVDLKNYDETIPPPGITFTGTELTAPTLGWLSDCIENDNGGQCIRSFNKPGNPGWQSYRGKSNLCGPMSVWIVLRGFGADISPAEVIKAFEETSPDAAAGNYLSDGAELAILINLELSENAHAALGEKAFWTYVGHWFKAIDNADEAMMRKLRDQWFDWGTYILTLVHIDIGYPSLGALSNGVSDKDFQDGGFGDQPRR